MKKIATLTFVLAMLLCLFGATGSFAATSGNFTYTVSDGKATITGYEPFVGGDVIIPSMLNGYPVTSIGGSAFADCEGLTNITIPDSVTSIGEEAFRHCDLIGITIPDSVTSIGRRAFDGIIGLINVYITDLAAWCNIEYEDDTANPLCRGGNLYINNVIATNITIPDSIISIAKYSFNGCISLKSITIPDSFTSIGEAAFAGCIGLTSITIPESVTSIGEYAFSNCRNLTSITIPDSVISIGEGAFESCYALEEITLPFIGSQRGNSGNADATFNYIFTDNGHGYSPSSLKKVIITDETVIGEGAFYDCRHLTSITIPESVTSIGDWAFEDCDNIIEVTTPFVFAELPNNIRKLTLTKTTEIPVSILKNYKNIQEVVLSNDITSIGEAAFAGCIGLTSITIPESVTSIGEYAFSNCRNLTSITIPNSVASIGESTFYGCSSLTSITIPNSVTSIGDHAFYDCRHLTSITIPESVTSIGDWAFESCSDLTSITIPNGVTSIGESTFYGCSSLTSITIPNSVTSIGEYAFKFCSGLTSITIPDSVTSIETNAFYGCDNIIEVVTPSVFAGLPKSIRELTLTKINKNSISALKNYKNIQEVVLSNNITSIEDSAFEDCSSLTSITIPDSVTSIGESAFSGCSGLTSITIPESVTSIGEGAFEGCAGLTSIAIPDSVTFIGSGVFNGCNNLTKISIPFVGSSADSVGKEALFGYIFGETPFFGAYAVSQVYDTIGSVATFYIPSNLTMIDVTKAAKVEYGAFNNCMNVLRIRFADGLNTVGRYAFAGCDMLSEVYLPDTITSIGSYVFDNSINVTIYAPEGSYVNTYAERSNIPFIASNGDIFVANKTVNGNTIVVKAYLPLGVSNNMIFVSCCNENDMLIQAVEKANYIDGQEIWLINQESVNYIKVYLWDSMQSMKPLAECVKLDM